MLTLWRRRTSSLPSNSDLRLTSYSDDALCLDTKAVTALLNDAMSKERERRLVLIAGQALARGMTLVTHNTNEFARVPGLQIEDWLV